MWAGLESRVSIGDGLFLVGAVLMAGYTVAAQRWRAAAGVAVALSATRR